MATRIFAPICGPTRKDRNVRPRRRHTRGTTTQPTDDAQRVAIWSRRDEIRSIAAGLFEKRGYSGTTMAHIAEAAGVLPGSLYHHFESKEAIAIELLELVQDDFERLRQRLAGDALESREDELARLVSEVMAVSYRHAGAVRLLAYEPPTVATVGFRDTVKRNVPELDRQWRSTLNALASTAGASRSDARIARFALQSLSFAASINFPRGTNPVELGSELWLDS
ncbi:TetR/AcrR family transcriptional regulator [Microbacterium sp. P5_E9]